MLSLGVLSFASPLVLLALAGLPLLWLLLRVTPPAPRTTVFPAIRLLYRLQAREEAPDRTPWWLLLLRLLIAALVIVALARPILNAADHLAGSGPVLLVIDDDWAAGRDWTRRIAAIDTLITQAERQGREVILLTTAGSTHAADGPLNLRPAPEARELVRGLEPVPWPSRPARLATHLQDAAIRPPAESVWISNGIRDEGEDDLLSVLRSLGAVTVIADRSEGPRIISLERGAGNDVAVRVTRPAAGSAAPVSARALAGDGRLLAGTTATFDVGDTHVRLQFALPVALRNEIGRIVLKGEGAGGVLLLDDAFRRRPVGLVSETAYRGGQLLLDDLHYIEQALAPTSDVTRGPLEELVETGMSTLVLADVGRLPDAVRTRLSGWVRDGGVLIRFAGPQLADGGAEQSQTARDTLVPVRLRVGDRTLGGALSWSAPLPITRFAPDGPFADIPSYDDVTVRRQVLAEPAVDLAERTWARLADGTPIVTGREHGKGWLVLFHTTPTPDWSNLALSGLFVEMLRRVVALGSGPKTDAAGSRLPPLETLDGLGHLGVPGPATRSWTPGSGTADSVVGPNLPPGFYGRRGAPRALNLVIDPEGFSLEPDPPEGVSSRGFDAGSERSLGPLLLVAACVLFLLDLLVTLALRGVLFHPRQGVQAGAVALLVAIVSTGTPSQAQLIERDGDPAAIRATRQTHLAYVVTGLERVDRVSRAGLVSLSRVLRERTSVEPPDPVGVDLATDELAFYPFLYWPIWSTHPPLAPGVSERINGFMRNGGTVVFDTRDRFETGPGGFGSGMQRLQSLTRDLDLPPLAPVAPDHVLGKAFYLLSEFPGRFAGGPVWVQDEQSASATDVSPVVVGSHDWAGAWARDSEGRFVFPVVPGGELQREFAFRFGVNLVMYTLTGNYKSDQVHVPTILDRLGQ